MNLGSGGLRATDSMTNIWRPTTNASKSHPLKKTTMAVSTYIS